MSGRNPDTQRSTSLHRGRSQCPKRTPVGDLPASHRHAFGIRELQIGPLARGIGVPGPTAPGVVFRAARYNAGLVEIVGDRLTFSGLGDDGRRFYSETVTAAELTPRIASPALARRPT
jgi:hypothetical protein